VGDLPVPPIPGVRRITPLTEGRPNLGGQVAAVAARLGITQRMPLQEHVYALMTEQLPGRRRDGRRRWAYTTIVVTVQRRAGKTTMRIPIAFHRCLIQPRARVWLTAQTRQDARDLMVEDVEPLVSHGDPSISRRVTLRKSQGSEGWRFSNGSTWRVFAPGETAGHSKASDLTDLDECWTLAPDQGRQITQGVAATHLTTGGQLSFISTMGTAARSRWFHARVDEARAAHDAGARDGTAIVDLGVPDELIDTLRAQLEHGSDTPEWWQALSTLATHHPAFGYTVESVADLANVARTEGTLYGVDGILRALGNVPTAQHTAAVSFTAWLRLQAPLWPPPPPVVVLGVDVGLERSDATICAAWAAAGIVYVDVVEHRPGADWVPAAVDQLATRWRRPRVFGVHGPATDTIATLRRNGHDTTILPGRAYATACQGVLDAISDGAGLTHRGHPALNDAVKVAATRESGDALVWSRTASAGTISALIAVTAARYGVLEAPPPGAQPDVAAG
jgi:hypothetical protein